MCFEKPIITHRCPHIPQLKPVPSRRMALKEDINRTQSLRIFSIHPFLFTTSQNHRKNDEYVLSLLCFPKFRHGTAYMFSKALEEEIESYPLSLHTINNLKRAMPTHFERSRSHEKIWRSISCRGERPVRIKCHGDMDLAVFKVRYEERMGGETRSTDGRAMHEIRD
jgi:hypothetical protein